MSKYIYGIDLSLKNTGITIYDQEINDFVYIESISTEEVKRKKGLYHNALKLKYLYDTFLELKKRYPPDAIAIERGFSRFNNATQTTFKAHGILNLAFHNIPQIYYTPKTIKATIIKGDVSKEIVRQVINCMYPQFEFADYDQSDSFAVLLTHLIKKEIIIYDKSELIQKLKKKGVKVELEKKTVKKRKTKKET